MNLDRHTSRPCGYARWPDVVPLPLASCLEEEQEEQEANQIFHIQTLFLDAIDGKQARRTNSSNPLGELFDHGCDSLSTVFVRSDNIYLHIFGKSAMHETVLQ